MIKNSKGLVLFGMHFYPGVAEYAPADRDPFRVFINESTIRKMDQSFTGRPVYVDHVDGVPSSLDKLKGEADGWVVESFYNKADGKHWVKFIICSEKGERAIKAGARLSNCYVAKAYANGGEWNGVSYVKEIVEAEYEHLALVDNPRYDESVVMTPEQFKAYNDNLNIELQRLANSKKGSDMGFSLFKRAKVENSVDIEGMMVVLPKSKREVAVATLFAEADELEVGRSKPRLCNGSDMVEMGAGGGEKKSLTVNDLLERHKAMNDELEAYKKKCVNVDDEVVENEDDDEEAKKKKKEAEEAEKTKNALEAKKKADDEAAKAAKKAADKAAADRLANANRNKREPETVSLGEDRVDVGRARYGSGD